jgi:hypothetical protein
MLWEALSRLQYGCPYPPAITPMHQPIRNPVTVRRNEVNENPPMVRPFAHYNDSNHKSPVPHKKLSFLGVYKSPQPFNEKPDDHKPANTRPYMYQSNPTTYFEGNFRNPQKVQYNIYDLNTNSFGYIDNNTQVTHFDSHVEWPGTSQVTEFSPDGVSLSRFLLTNEVPERIKPKPSDYKQVDLTKEINHTRIYTKNELAPRKDYYNRQLT